MTIHSDHPFATPAEARDPGRRLRGRLAASVSVWATGSGTGRAGLTVGSWLVVAGEPVRLVGMIDPDSDLAHALGDTVAVSLLHPDEASVAEVFAGGAPAPGGPFRVVGTVDTPWGPVLEGERTWVGARVEGVRPLGWSVEVVAIVEEVRLADDEPLIHLRGRSRRLA